MNRKLPVVLAVAAVVALSLGVTLFLSIKLGGLLSSSSTDTPSARADVVRFKDDVSKVSLDYPADWQPVPRTEDDPEVALLVADNLSTSLLMRVSAVGLETVTRKTLPIVRKLTDDLIGADPRAKQLIQPVAVVLGDLPGWRYRYTYGSGETGGAHDHYFLFKGGRMIQLVFQASPASRLPALAATFDRIAATFKGRVQ